MQVDKQIINHMFGQTEIETYTREVTETKSVTYLSDGSRFYGRYENYAEQIAAAAQGIKEAYVVWAISEDDTVKALGVYVWKVFVAGNFVMRRYPKDETPDMGAFAVGCAPLAEAYGEEAEIVYTIPFATEALSRVAEKTLAKGS